MQVRGFILGYRLSCFFTLKSFQIIRDNGTKLKQIWCPRIRYGKWKITFLFKIFNNYVQRIIGIYSHYGTKALIMKKTLKWIKFITYSQTTYVKPVYLFPRTSYPQMQKRMWIFLERRVRKYTYTLWILFSHINAESQISCLFFNITIGWYLTIQEGFMN